MTLRNNFQMCSNDFHQCKQYLMALLFLCCLNILAYGQCTDPDNTLPIASCQNATVQLVNGSYTLTSADIDDGSSDNCGIAQMCVSGEVWETSSGTLELSDPTFFFDDSDPNVACFLDQTFGCCELVDGDHHYDEAMITITSTDTYIFTLNDIAGITDFAGMIYSAPFDPANPCANLLDGDDDNNSQGGLDPLLCMVMDLTPGTYYLVTTTYGTGDDGFPADYTWDIQQGCNAELDCDDIGTLNINLIVKDDSGNVSTCSATVTVEGSTLTPACAILTLSDNTRCPGPLGPNTPNGTISYPNAAGILVVAYGGLGYDLDVNCVTATGIENVGFQLQTSVATTNTACELVIEQVYDLIDECDNVLEDALTTVMTLSDGSDPAIDCPADAVLICGDNIDPYAMNCDQVFLDGSITEADFSGSEEYINFDEIVVANNLDIVGNEYAAQGLILNANDDLSYYSASSSCTGPVVSSPNGIANVSSACDLLYGDITLNFTSLMNRVGFYVFSQSGASLTIQVECLLGGTVVDVQVLNTGGGFTYYGIESANGFDQINLISTGGTNDAIAIDDIRFEGCEDALPLPVVLDQCNATLAYVDGDLQACDVTAGGPFFERTWTATDDCGNSSSCVQTITLIDDEAPTLVCYPFNPQPGGSNINNPVVVGTSQHWTTDGGGTLILSNNIDVCDGEVTFNTPDVEDNCDNSATLRMRITQNVDTDPSISFDQDVSESEQRDEFFPKGLTYVEFFATDDCGNESAVDCDFYILVVDDIAPVINSTLPDDTTVECFNDPAVVSPPDLEFQDNCDNDGEAFLVSAISETTPGTCPNNFVIVHTWTYTQECDEDGDPNTPNLTTTHTQTVTVDDQTAPVIECPADIAVECDESTEPAATGEATATDNCMDSDPADGVDYPVITFTDASTQDADGIAGTCDDYQYEITRTWTAIDECGNTSSCDQIITVDDTTAPEIVCPADIEVNCDESMDPEILVEGFTGDFDPANWTIDTNGGGGSVDVSGAPANVSMLSSDNGNTGDTEFCIAVPADGAIAFEWSYITNDISGSFWDPFGYTVNGVFVQLTIDGVTDPQSGLSMVNLSAGDEFCFVQATVDGVLGSATTISDMFMYESEGTGIATATDNCSATDISFSDAITPGDCLSEYTITRTWTATDACGNSSSCEQTIEVVDDEAPVITCPADAEVSCEDDLSSAATGVATAEDNCSTLEITESDLSDQGTDPSMCAYYSYEIARTWTATDACGNESSCVQMISVNDNTAPVWDLTQQLDVTLTTEEGYDCPADAEISLNIGDEISVFDTWTVGGYAVPDLDSAVEDNCAADDYLTIRVIDKTKTVAPDNCSSVLTITFEAEDPCENVEGTFSCSYTFVDDTAPVITPGTEPLDQELTASYTGCTQLAYIWMPFATDNCQDLDFSNVSVSANGVNFSPVTPGFNPNGGFGFYWTGLFSLGTTEVTITVDDGCGNEVSITHEITVVDTEPPFLKTPCPDNILATTDGGDCDTTLTFTNPEYDDFCLCAGMEVCFTSDDIDPSLLPENVSYVGTSGNLADITATFYKGTTTVTFKVSDPSGNINDECSFDVVVEDNDSPTFADQTDYCFFTEDGATCPGDAVISATVGPFNFDDSFTAGGISVDGPASSDYADNCPEMYLEILSIDEVLTTCNVTWTIVWQVTDCGGNTATQDQVIEIKDNTAPIITCPADVEVECDESTEPVGDPSAGILGTGEATAIDGCTAVTITYNDVSTQGPDPSACDFYNYIITRTWTAVDECENSNTCEQIITVSDTEAPEITCPADAIVNCDASVDPDLMVEGFATATDNCSAAEVTFSDVIIPGSCPQEYTIERTWTATDVCGNSNDCIQTIEVVDEEAPVIDPAAQDLTVECDGLGNQADLDNWLATNGGASATDNCGEVSWSYAPDPAVISDECGATGSVEVTFTASDECGNSSATTATFTIEDTTPPSGDDPSGVMELNVCKDEASVALPQADDIAAIEDAYSDICGEISASFVSEECTGDDCAWVLTREYLVTDECGNETPSTIIHMGGDTSPPEFTTTPDDQEVEIVGTDCSQVVYIYVPQYADNCTDMNLTHVSISADPFVNFAPIQQDVVTGQYFWTGLFEAGVTDVTITITDDCDLSTSDTHTITVIDDEAPFISLSECPSDVELDTDDGTCQTTYSWQNPSYQDNCQCNRMEICFSSDDAAFVPAMITYQEASGNAALVGPLDFAKGTTTVCYKVYDDSDNLNDECCFDVVVLDDEFPTASETIPGDTFECASEIPEPDIELVTDEEDNCPDPVVTWDSDTDNGGSGCNGDPLVVMRTYNVTDCGDNVVQVTQEFVVEDLTAPTASDPEQITVDCEADIPAADPEVVIDEADNCDGELTVTLVSESSTGGTGCGDPLVITRDYLVEDCGGLSTTVSHVITVDDQTAPIAVCKDFEVVLDPNGVATIEATDIDDGSSDVCGEVTLSLDITEFTCADWGTPVQVTLTVEDENCNISTCTAMVTVLDDEVPVAVCPANPIELFLDENGVATLAADSAGDGSSTDNCSVTETNPEVMVSCEDISIDGTTTVTVDITATDACGLTSVVTCDVFVFDNLGPVATSCQTDIIDNALTGECFNQFDWLYPVFLDNCDGTLEPVDPTTLSVTTSDPNVNVQFESTGLEGDFPVGTTTVTMCTTDSNGNEGCCSFDITVLDGAPAIADFEIVVDGLEVCTDNLSMNGVSYNWDLGDGTTSNDEDLCHTFAEPGSYMVCLTVTSACGTEDELCEEITVETDMLVELTPSFLTDGTTFAENQCRDAVYIIDNLDIGNTNGIVQFLISKPSAFTMTIDPNATNANVFGGLPANNSDWVITDIGNAFLLTMPMPNMIPGSGYTIIAMELCATGLPTSTGQTTGQLINFTGGDVELGNNYAQGSIIIN